MLENKINELLESVSFGLQESLLTDSISLGEYNRQTVDYYNVYNEICKNEFDFRIVLESNTGITVKPENVIKYLKWKLKLKDWQFTVNSGYNNVPSVQAEFKNDNEIVLTISFKFNSISDNKVDLTLNLDIPKALNIEEL